jgi:MoaA/NifB/PqqE/SkfB family radical SAM enzyme
MPDLTFADGVISRMRDKPFNIEFGVTRRCNSQCQMCNQWKLPPYKELSLDEIDKIFASYPYFKIVGITGGEPTLRSDLKELCIHIMLLQPHLKRMFITSNGFQPSILAETARTICQNMKYTQSKPLLTVLISLDGPRELHNFIRNRPFAYDCAVESLKKLVQVRNDYPQSLRIATSTTYGPLNYKDYDQVLEEMNRIRDEYLLDQPTYCLVWFGNIFDKEQSVAHMEYFEALKKDRYKIINSMQEGGSLTNARKLFIEYTKYIIKNPHKQVIPCEGARVRYFLNSVGDVYPCIVWNRKILSLREVDYDFTKVLEAPIRKTIREEIQQNKCPICYLSCEFIPTMLAHPWQVLRKKEWRRHD